MVTRCDFSQVGELPDAIRLASVERYREAICRALAPGWRGCSIDEAATAVIRALEQETRNKA